MPNFANISIELRQHHTHPDHRAKSDQDKLAKLDCQIIFFNGCLYTFNEDMLAQLQEGRIGKLETNRSDITPNSLAVCSEPFPPKKCDTPAP